ncbi:MAG: nodulation protein NfeD, partial [Crenarchaeota archaeon]|nr:nodulation protein NfeD [Thermoproteota archaeon]
PAAVHASQPGTIVVVGTVHGVISGATVDYVRSLLDYALQSGASLVVLRLDTPGGGLEPALAIAQLLLDSPLPVVGFVDGRWAMSAGTMILVCTDVAAMKPTAIIGAVQPVALSPSGEYRPINETKILNPVYKEIEVCMKVHGRNTTLAKLFVYKNLVLNAEEAARLGAVEYIAGSLAQLLERINGTRIERLNMTLLLREPVTVEEFEMPPGLLLAQILSDPLVSSLISSIALLLILVALSTGHPHLIALAVGLLLLGLFGLGLSAGLVAVALILVGIVFLVVELVAIPGFGAVGVTGIILLVIGFIVAFTGRPVYIAGEALQQALRITLAVTAPIAGLMIVILVKAVEAWKQKPVYQPSPVGKRGRAVDPIPPGGTGFIIVEGEYWQARNVSEKPIKAGDEVVVKGKSGTILLVEPAPGSA